MFTRFAIVTVVLFVIMLVQKQKESRRLHDPSTAKRTALETIQTAIWRRIHLLEVQENNR